MTIRKQNDVKDCGVVLIQSLNHHYFKRWIPINILKQQASYGAKGINISNLVELADIYGVKLEAFEVDYKNLLKNSNKDYFITTIQNEGENHYVLARIKSRVEIYDPVKGKYTLSIEEFGKIFEGLVMTIKEGHFEHKNIELRSPLRFILTNPSIISWLAIAIVLTTLISLTSSIFMKVVLDKILPGALTNTLNILVIGFAWIGFLKVSISMLKSYMMKKLMLNVETTINLKYFQKMRKASIHDLTKITTTDHIRRMSLIEHVSSFISNTLFVLFADALNFMLATGILVWISPSVFGFALIAAGLIIIISLLTHMFVRGEYDSLITTGLTSMTSSLDMIYSFQDIKLSKDGEKMSDKQINDYFTFKNKGMTIWRLTSVSAFINGLIHTIFPTIFVYIFVHNIFASANTVGTMIMFLSLFNIFISPVEDFALLGIKYKQNIKNIELLDFVLRFEDEKLNPNGVEIKNVKSIKFQNVLFGYDKDLFKIDNWTINSNIHITGVNGSGKSSILNLISSKYKTEGKLSINNMEMDFISKSKYRESIFFAHPMSFFPNRTVFEYITNNEKESIKTFKNNIMKFNLTRLFTEMGIDLNKPIVNNGANFSSGQKQMLQIMKLFSRKYSLILIDEGVENIDAKKVKWLAKAISQVQQGIFIEVSHSGKYLSYGKEVPIATIIKSPY